MVLKVLITAIVSLIAYIAYYTHSISDDYKQDISCFVLTDKHIKSLRNSAVTWDTTEAGAPMLSFELTDLLFPGKLMANETLNTNNRAIVKSVTLQIFLNAANLQSGEYAFDNPFYEDDNHNDRISNISELFDLYNQDSISFNFTDNHAKLLKATSAGFSYGVVGIDPKRPFGDATAFEYDIADIVGETYPVTDDNTGNMSEAMLYRMAELYYQLLPALQVLLINGEIETGKYCRENAYSEWIKS